MSVQRLLLSLVLSTVAAGSMAAAPTTAQLDQARTRGLAWLVTHQNGDGSWKSPNGLAIQSTAAALDALGNAGVKKGYVYAAGQAWLANADGMSVDSLSRKSVALFRAGANVAPLLSQLLSARNDLEKSWGAYPKYQASFPDSALALDAILATGTAYADTGYTVGFIAGYQNADGGWSYATGSSAPAAPASRLIPAAYNVLVLSRARAKGWAVDANITNGVNWLVSQQKPDGGFADDPLATAGSPLETAVAWLALTQAKVIGNAAAVAAQAARDNASAFLVNNQGADGSWSADPFATAMALQTVPSASLADSNGNGVPDAVEAQLGWNPSAPNHALAAGNGQSAAGVTTAKPVGAGFQYQTVSLGLANPVSGGTGPYTWRVSSGYLPDGLALNAATGQITGTATSTGTFNFSYTVQDAANAITTVEAQITIAPDTSEGVPTLPQWGAIVMALLLMGMTAAMGRNSRKR